MMTTTKTKETTLPLENRTKWKLSVTVNRVLIETLNDDDQLPNDGWTALSSAVLNGGFQNFGSSLKVLNAKVPTHYDGLDPEPQKLLRDIANQEVADEQSSGNDEKRQQKNRKDDDDGSAIIGQLTAASMGSLRVVSESATGKCGQTLKVDAIVTAGISNARMAGADSDVFYFVEKETKHKQKTGTINATILTNIHLDASVAMLEAYTVAVEAKCRALSELGIQCAKHPEHQATGTGTDSTVLICPIGKANEDTIKYAQKHTLVAELIGKAVYEATKQAVESNLEYNAGSIPFPSMVYRMRCHKRKLLQALQRGHCPLIPSQPKDPTPKPSGCVLLIGLVGLLLATVANLYQWEGYSGCPSISLYTSIPGPSINALVAVFFADRFLGSLFVPLIIHPVMCIGKVISLLKAQIPEQYFDETQRVRGFLTGIVLWLVTVVISVGTAWVLLICPRFLMSKLPMWLLLHESATETCVAAGMKWQRLSHTIEFLLHVFILRGSLSLQLLCNVANQMAYFLERGQLQQARNQLMWLCSRDPSNLQPDELAGATLESLSENLSDSVTSPLFYYALFGPLGSLAFRVANTLDSRVGYRGRCEWVGKFSARIDDILNIVSARLTALVLVLAAAICDPPRATSVIYRGLSVAWRDANQCESPNAGWPMACLAGILEVKLDKRDHYSLNGPPNSGNGRSPKYEDIRKGHLITQVAGFILSLLVLFAGLIQ